jgi:hypothetical protein
MRRFLYYIVAIAFLGWCVVTFKTDIIQIKFTQVWEAKSFILFAGVLSSTNYLLRTIRWYVYLLKLGHPMKFSFCLLTYISGFAFTLSPGKVGEMMRGHDPSTVIRTKKLSHFSKGFEVSG